MRFTVTKWRTKEHVVNRRLAVETGVKKARKRKNKTCRSSLTTVASILQWKNPECKLHEFLYWFPRFHTRCEWQEWHSDASRWSSNKEGRTEKNYNPKHCWIKTTLSHDMKKNLLFFTLQMTQFIKLNFHKVLY